MGSRPYLDPHPRNVVQRVPQALQVSAKAELGAHHVGLVDSTILVVVGRVAIHETIQEYGVEGEPPVLGRSGILESILALAPVVEGVRGCSVRVEVIVDLVGIKPEARNECGCTKDGEKKRAREEGRESHGDCRSLMGAALEEKRETRRQARGQTDDRQTTPRQYQTTRASDGDDET